MKARPRELVAALALVAAADTVVRRSAGLAVGGPGVALFVLFVAAVVVVAARARLRAPRALVIAGILVALALRCAYGSNEGVLAISMLAVPALALAIRSRTASTADVVASVGATFVTTHTRLAAAFRGVRDILASRRETKASERLAQVLVPLLLAGLFVAIFALANPLVGAWLDRATRAFPIPGVEDLVFWFVTLVGSVLLLRPALKRLPLAASAETTSGATDGQVALARNTLVALNAIFLLENLLDATYLWAGSPPPGVSERAYAHEGAAWLTVAIALVTVVVGVLFRGALAHDPKAKATRALAFVWLAQGAVLALGTYRRLWIHIRTSGTSSVRILGIVGTTLVVVALVHVGYKLLRGRSFVWLLRRQLDAIALGLLAFALAPTHRLSAPVNLRRVMAHEYQALVHVEEETREAESATSFLPMLAHDDERIRRGIAALLLDERDHLRSASRPRITKDQPLAEAWALRELDLASPRLEAVLGDVERVDAIRQFEYIRNSAIEGEIAQSEISKVELAETRSERALKLWLAEQASSSPPRRLASATRPSLVETTDPNRLEADVAFATFPSPARLVLTRRRPGEEWRVEERVTMTVPIHPLAP